MSLQQSDVCMCAFMSAELTHELKVTSSKSNSCACALSHSIPHTHNHTTTTHTHKHTHTHIHTNYYLGDTNGCLGAVKAPMFLSQAPSLCLTAPCVTVN